MYEYQCVKCGKWFISLIKIFVKECMICRECRCEENENG